MKTVQRICIEDYEVTDGDKHAKLTRGKEYLTTPTKDGTCTVFTSYWMHDVPVRIFAGARKFT